MTNAPAADASAGGPPATREPLLRVTAGNPDEAELAALVAVVSALAAGGGATRAAEPEQHWATPAHVRRRYPRSWSASRRPR